MAAERSESLAAPPALDAAILVVALSGVSFSGPLIAATAAPALAIAFWRNSLAALVTVPVAIVRSGRAVLGSPAARRSAVLAGLALSVHFATWVPSVKMTSVATATALVSTQSVFVALLAQLAGRRLPRGAWIGIGVSTFGTVLITGAALGLSTRALVGDLLAIIGGLAAAVYVTIGSRARQELSTTLYTAICYTVCSVVLLVVCVVAGARLSGYSSNAWIKIVLVTCCAQLLGHTLFNVVLRSTSATVVSLVILFETPGAALVAALWLHQRPPYTAIPGMVLLFAGLVLVVRARGQDQPVDAID
jgi:drug/metabolite transporter (DMT)-like permease